MTLRQGWHGKSSGIFCMQTVSHLFRDNDQISLKEHFQIIAKEQDRELSRDNWKESNK